MSTALTAVRRRFPKMEIRLVATTDEAGPDEVLHGRLDMVILSRFGGGRPAPAAGLRAWVLGRGRRAAMRPRRSPFGEFGRVPHRGPARRVVDRLASEQPWSAHHQHVPRRRIRAEPGSNVNDIGTAIGPGGHRWGITLAPELTPVDPNLGISPIRIAEINTVRQVS